MLKEATYKEKFSFLQKWMPAIVDAVKKDLRNEHLKQDYLFVKKYFGSKNINKLTQEEMVEGYSKAIQQEEKGEEIAEFITSRWLLKNTELYDYFEEELKKINPDFTQITSIDKSKAKAIMDGGIEQFGAPRTYLFSVMNSVAFSEEDFKALGKQAEEEAKRHVKEEVAHSEKASLEQMQRSFNEQINRLTDKYEKKLLGLQKKYTTDVDGLKKQLAALQRKLEASK